MEYIGNRPPGNTGGYDPYDTGGYWWNYNNPYGAYDPYGYNTPVTSWEDQIRQSGGTAPPQNPDVDANGNPIFRTDVVGNAPPVETTGSDIGQLDPYLAQYLSSLPQGQVGGTGANFSTTGWDVADWGGGEGGGDPTKTRPPINGPSITTPPNEDGGERGNTYTYFSDPSFGDPTRGNTYTYFTDPSARGNYNTYFAPVPTTPPSTKPPIVPPWIGGPLDTPKPKPPKTQTGEEGGGGGGGGQQQPKKPGVGDVLAALPFLAAFQGGTTTTPAPYAHLGPHTPVAPTFKPQGRGNPIPSIGQLLAGVR